MARPARQPLQCVDRVAATDEEVTDVEADPDPRGVGRGDESVHLGRRLDEGPGMRVEDRRVAQRGGGVGQCVEGIDEAIPARVGEDARAGFGGATGPGRPIGRQVERHAQDLAASLVQEAQALEGELESVGCRPVGRGRQRGIDLGQAQVALSEGGLELGALREPQAELCSRRTRSARSRRGSSSRQCPAAAPPGPRCSRGSARCRWRPVAGHRRDAGGWREGCGQAPSRCSTVLLLGHAGGPSRALLGMVLRAGGVPPARLVGPGPTRSRSTRTWTSDGPPDARALPTAARTSAGSSTVSACNPNARPIAAKSAE